MAVCGQCGREADPDARFCAGCGSPLAVVEPQREERKVVTVLFADLVGFTARSESLDPEDVRALLSPYYARLRSELELFGGTVEKFIGDAVMALFGAPVAHEDDPERAVRAALAIRDWVAEESDLHVRIAVNTGEALVVLGARTADGEGMASGDVVNTAARLQASAPVDGILVGESTYRATRHAVDYRDAAPVEAKGKRAPIAVWQPLQARSRFGVDVVQRTQAPLVGRERELDLLLDALARSRAERTPQLVTLVGVPGIGKSRLVSALFEAVDAEADTYLWRQGRCLPYGEGSFWALGEIVKAHVGIHEDEGREQEIDKLARAVREAVPEPDADWIEAHLRTLVGFGIEREPSPERREEAFAAWRGFLEGIAEKTPLVLVFEDLHWADDGLLDFVDHLVEWAQGVAVLVVCLARPELLERRPGWGGGKLNAFTVALSPLSDDDTARLLAGVLEQAVLPAETQVTLLERAGGNPLYAEQYARLFVERRSADDLPLPENVQGIIAARLDGLPVEEKAVLQDAAVLGKVFWAGALGEHERLDALLHSLERKEFIRRERRASIGGETELAFRHVLVRDVAYAQIPRAARARKHERAADWIESLGRAEDHAALVAHHCGQAFELARAAGLQHDRLEARARAALQSAGERAFALNEFDAAAGFLQSALELVPRDDVGRPRLLLALGRALSITGQAGFESLTEAAEALLTQGDREGAAEAECMLSREAWLEARHDSARAHIERAQELVRDRPPSPAKAAVLAQTARMASVAGRRDEAMRVGRQTLELAEQFGLHHFRASALTSIGTSRTGNGDWGGIADFEQALEIASAINAPSLQAHITNNLAFVLMRKGELSRGRALHRENVRLSERIGSRAGSRWGKGELVEDSFREGSWDEALAAANEFIAESERSPHYLEPLVRNTRARIGAARGDLERALTDTQRALELAGNARESQVVHPCRWARAYVLLRAGRREEAVVLVDELIAEATEPDHELELVDWPEVPSVLCDLERERAGAVLLPGVRTPLVEAFELGLHGDWAGAAEIWAELECPTDEAFARLRAAEALVAQGRRDEADLQLRRALAFYRTVGAVAVIGEAEALVAAAG